MKSPPLKQLTGIALLALGANSQHDKDSHTGVSARDLSIATADGPISPKWSGIFETPESAYIWISQKVTGSYVDPSMRLVVLPVDTASEESMESVENAAIDTIGSEGCTLLTHGETIVPGPTCYNLVFSDDRWETTFPINASSTNAIAVFTQHVPTEFKEDAHYLKLVLSGQDIEPVAVKSFVQIDDDVKPWGKVIGASVLINLCTFIGIVFSVPMFAKILKKADPTFVYAAFASFAAGAILSCAFFLLLFESTHLIATGWKGEADQVWRWGTMILLGLILPALVDTFIGHTHGHEETSYSQGQDPKTDEEAPKITEAPGITSRTFSQQARLIFSICFGDFVHNLSDGFFVGAAFLNCDESMAWSIAIATILHELPQELSDYLILTGPQVGLSTLWALTINFVTGLSVLIGAIIVLSVDVSDASTGLLLAFGGGVYLQIGAVECMPKMLNPVFDAGRKLFCITAFIVGTVLIGLVLLDHEHCGGDGHDLA